MEYNFYHFFFPVWVTSIHKKNECKEEARINANQCRITIIGNRECMHSLRAMIKANNNGERKRQSMIMSSELMTSSSLFITLACVSQCIYVCQWITFKWLHLYLFQRDNRHQAACKCDDIFFFAFKCVIVHFFHIFFIFLLRNCRCLDHSNAM